VQVPELRIANEGVRISALLGPLELAFQLIDILGNQQIRRKVNPPLLEPRLAFGMEGAGKARSQDQKH